MSVAIASSLYKPPVSTTSKNAAEINIQLSGSLSRKKYLIQDKTQHIKTVHMDRLARAWSIVRLSQGSAAVSVSIA